VYVDSFFFFFLVVEVRGVCCCCCCAIVWVVFVVMFEKLRKEDEKNVRVLIKGEIFVCEIVFLWLRRKV